MPTYPSNFRRGSSGHIVAITSLIISLLGPHLGMLAAQPPVRSDGEQYSETRKLRELGLPVELRNALNSALMAQITELDRVCQLTPEQRTKLRLMGQGDIKHFFDMVRDYKRPKEQDMTWFALTGMVEAGIFHDGSLFGKFIPKILSEKQLALRAPAVKEARRRRQEQATKLVLEALEQNQPFKPGEREQFVALLKEIPPPRTEGEVGLVYLLFRLAAKARTQPNKLTATRLDWLTDIENSCKSVAPILQQAGYFSEEENDQAIRKK